MGGKAKPSSTAAPAQCDVRPGSGGAGHGEEGPGRVSGVGTALARHKRMSVAVPCCGQPNPGPQGCADAEGGLVLRWGAGGLYGWD